MGFGGKLAIHPLQIAPMQAAFRPSPEDIAWAQEVTQDYAAASADGVGAIVVRGRLVDVPVLKQAEQLLAPAG